MNFDDPFAMLGPSFGGFPLLSGATPKGLRLRVVNNGDGTATLTWSGYNLEAVDVDGTWEIQVSTDGTTFSELVTGIASSASEYTATTGEGTYYLKVAANDNADDQLQISNRVSVTVTADDMLTDDSGTLLTDDLLTPISTL
jgi:hypothetical protein